MPSTEYMDSEEVREHLEALAVNYPVELEEWIKNRVQIEVDIVEVRV